MAIYSTLAACAFFAGYVSDPSILIRFELKVRDVSFINNKIGSRLTLFLGTTGYALSVGSYLSVSPNRTYISESVIDRCCP